MTKKKHLTAKEYGQIKILLGALNNNANKVSKLVDRSAYTVGVIKKSTSFEDYHRINNERYKTSKRGQAVKQPQVAQVQTPPALPSEDVTLLMANMNDTLLEIRDIFKWISENVEVKPKNRFRF